MLRFTFFASLLIQLLYISTVARGSEETQNVSNITPSAATKSDAVSDLDDKIENMDNASEAETKTSISEASGAPSVITAAVEVTNSPAESTLTETGSVETEMATTKVVDGPSKITTQTNTTAFITSNSTADSNDECTIRVGFFWWKKVKIPVKRAYINARKCELQYCTPSLKIESFTCKNLLALTVPPDSTEDLMNEWKLECTKHQCIPAKEVLHVDKCRGYLEE